VGVQPKVSSVLGNFRDRSSTPRSRWRASILESVFERVTARTTITMKSIHRDGHALRLGQLVGSLLAFIVLLTMVPTAAGALNPQQYSRGSVNITPTMVAVAQAAHRQEAVDQAVSHAEARLRRARHHQRVASSDLAQETYERDQLASWFDGVLTHEAIEARNSFPARDHRIAELERHVRDRREIVEAADESLHALLDLQAAASSARIDQARRAGSPSAVPTPNLDAGFGAEWRWSQQSVASAHRAVLHTVPGQPGANSWPSFAADGGRFLQLDEALLERLTNVSENDDAASIGEDDGRAMVWPGIGAVNSGFGWRVHPVWGGRRMHDGIDIDAPYGEAVVASSDGEVTVSGWNGGYGRMVKIDHGDGLETRYAHLETLDVEVGDVVRQGEQLGTVGATGTATDAHIHFEVRVDGAPVDPLIWLP